MAFNVGAADDRFYAVDEDRRCVLIVDDDDDNAALLAGYVERLGRTAVRARTGEDAIRMAFSSPVDLVIVDLLLPGVSGWQVVAKLRSEKSTSQCPIVVCSVLDRQDYPRDVQGALPKPYTRRQVELLLDRLLPADGS